MENFGYVLATRKLVEEHLPVGFMYREKASNGDSGWRFFSGTEDQDYVDNPDNIKIYDIETILNIDKSIRPYLQSAAGTAFERNAQNRCFSIVEGFAFGADLEEA